jgi:hypothetical protein
MVMGTVDPREAVRLPAAFDMLRDEGLRRLTAYWPVKRRGASVARAAAIDPAEIPWALLHLWISEWIREAWDFRYRFAGEHIQGIFGMPLQGQYLREIMPAAAFPTVLERYRTVILESVVAHNFGPVFLESGRIVPGERVIMPLALDDGRIEHVLGMTAYWRLRPEDDRFRTDVQLETTYIPVAAPD